VKKTEFKLKWDAFISYRRSDGTKTARWLRSRFHSYKLPKILRKKHQKKVRTYLDTSYEQATEDFFEKTIAPALKQSRFLIVVSSPDALKPNDDGSPNWVVKEIEYFGNLSQGNNVATVLARGEFTDPLPGDLKERFPNIEIIDLRSLTPGRYFWWPKRWRLEKEFLKLVAPIYDISQEEMPILKREETRRRRRRFWGVIVTISFFLVLLTAFAIYAWSQRREADRQAEIGWILKTQDIIKRERGEKQKEVRKRLKQLRSNYLNEEIDKTLIALLDKPDLEKIDLPSGVDIARAVLPSTKDYKNWSWINFAQAVHPGAGIAVSDIGNKITVALSGAIPFTIDVSSGRINTVSSVENVIRYPIASSPNGRFVAGRGHDNNVYLWDINQGLLGTLKKDENDLGVRYLLFSPDSSMLLITDDQSFSFWEVLPLKRRSRSTSYRVHELSPLGSIGMGFNRNASVLAMAQFVDGGRLRQLKLWSIPECKLLAKAGLENISHNGSPSFDPASRIAFHPNGRILFQALGKQGIARWSLEQSSSNALKINLDGIIQNGQGANAISVSPDGCRLLVSESDESPEISIWTINSNNRELLISPPDVDKKQRDIRHLQWSQTGDYVYWTTVSGINLYRFIKPLSRKIYGSLKFIEKYRKPITSIALSPSGRWLVTQERAGKNGMRLIDLQHPNLKEMTLPVDEGPVVFVPGSENFWIWGFSMTFWKPGEIKPEKTQRLPVFWVSDGAIDRTGKKIGLRMGNLIDLDSGFSFFSLEPPMGNTEFHNISPILSPDGSHILVVEGRRYTDIYNFKLYHVGNKRIVMQEGGLQIVYSKDLALNAKRFALGLQDRALVYTLGDESPKRELVGPPGEFTNVAISPDGLMIATAGTSGDIVVWDAEKGKEIFTFSAREVSSIIIRSHPPLLISGHKDGSLRIWNLEEVKEAVSRFKNASTTGLLN
jgi:WD40 repeat protein